jgi:hypothetical protein
VEGPRGSRARQSLAADECISSTALEVWENLVTDSFLYDKISPHNTAFCGMIASPPGKAGKGGGIVFGGIVEEIAALPDRGEQPLTC